MGVTFALASMLCFAANILMTRYALTRLPVEAGFFIVLVTNILFPALLYPFELAARTAPWSWDWKSAGLFALGGVIGMFLGRRFLFDTVRMLGPSRASVFHSTAPAFALLGAWLLADERLGLFEIGLMAVVWLGLWFTQPRSGRGSIVAGDPISPANVRRGMLAGLLAVAGFGFGSVLRGLAMRGWEEAVFGTILGSAAALACQVLATRDWARIAAQLRGAGRAAVWLYAGCGIATSLGSILMALAMNYIEIALAVLVVHTTPLVIFPVSVFILKNREELTPRTLVGALMVLSGIALLAFR
ncbi:MAG: DMT family transporter [Betaproteobacteria bacterium]|nr:DMT family transporter [Betaproteobacteria bacterium]